MLTNAVCIAAWLPFLIPKRGTHGENCQTSQYRWTPRRPPLSPFLNHTDRTKEMHTAFGSQTTWIAATNWSRLRIAWSLQSDPHILTPLKTFATCCGCRTMTNYPQVQSEKYWKDLGDRFQDVPGVDCRQKCHNSHDIWGLLRKNIIAPAPSS